MKSFDQHLASLLKEGKSEDSLRYIEDAICADPSNLDLKIRCALHLQGPPFLDYYEAIDILNDVLDSKPFLPDALILLAFIEEVHRGDITSDTIQLVNKAIETVDAACPYYGQLFMLNAFYYRFKDPSFYLSSLDEAVAHDPETSLAYYWMSKYWKNIDIDRSIKLVEVSMRHVLHIYGKEEFFDPTSFDEFVQERIRGVHLSSSNFQARVEYLDGLKQSPLRL